MRLKMRFTYLLNRIESKGWPNLIGSKGWPNSIGNKGWSNPIGHEQFFGEP